MAKQICSLLITDLDDTLWDWFAIWSASFGAMLAETARISGIPEIVLEQEIKVVHQKHRTSAYAFVLEELLCEGQGRAAPDHELPTGMTAAQLRKHPAAHYQHRRTTHRHTPEGAIKPNPDVLQAIIAEMGCDRSSVVYVGDNLMKDVGMAQSAGFVDVWAEYGVSHAKEAYAQLVRVTHWTPADVAREKALTREIVRPTHAITDFAQLLDLFQFGPFVVRS